MRYTDELEPKLSEIRRLAANMFSGLELRPVGLYLNDRNEVEFDPASPMNQPAWGSKPWTDDERRRLVETRLEVTAKFFADLNVLIDRFRSYSDLDALNFGWALGILGVFHGQETVRVAPANVRARIDYADHRLVAQVDGLIYEQLWSGPAAGDFQTEFLSRFHDSAEMQQQYAYGLGVLVGTYREFREAIVRALLMVADQCIEALGGPPIAMSAEELSWSTNALSIGSIITGVMSLFPPLAPVFGPLSVSLGVAGFLLPLTREARTEPLIAQVGGVDVWEVLDSAWNALNAIEGAYGDADATLAGTLQEAMNSMEFLGNPALVVLPPDLADRPSFGTFNAQRPPGVTLDPVVVSIVDLHKAGKIHLAGAAAHYAEAAQELSSCVLGGPMDKFFPRSVPAFHSARDLLYSTLTRTSEALDAAAGALLTIAQNYTTTDEQAAEIMRRILGFATPDARPEPARAGGI